VATAKDKDLATLHEARQVAEAAREKDWEKRSFARALFEGRFRLDLLHPAPPLDPDEQARASGFLAKLETFAREHIDGDAIDRDGHVPQSVLDGLAELGAFGMKIPPEYGGLGLSQRSYNRALAIVASRCGSTGAYLSAHQSIGVPGPIIKFGTEEQKKEYLPRLARGELSAFALTESDVGSDPANMTTTAVLSEDGSHWVLNGEKLWTTNGPRADIIIVMARTPAPEGSKRRPISAFVVETAWEGVETVHECHFMGLRGLSNGVLRFTDVKVPVGNLVWGEGKGLKLALITLNTGRLALPAFCAAAGKGALEMCRHWAGERVQWGLPVGKHDAVAQMLGKMTADTFAMESVVELTSRMADSGSFDIRLEAAIAKMWATEVGWELTNDAVQVRGGRGYETHDSLLSRGEVPYPVERYLRDMRINTIFEGSSEIMRLFIAREAVDQHLDVAGDLVEPEAPIGAKLAALVRAGIFYAWWYPTRFLGWSFWPRYSEFGPLARHLRFVASTSRRLARSTFHTMVRFGPKLERRQAVLGRIVDVGAELFVMTSVCVNAQRMLKDDPSETGPRTLADLYCRQARRRIARSFDVLFDNDDTATYQVALELLEGRHTWLEEGIVSLEGYRQKLEEAVRSEEGAPKSEPAGTPVGA
jgi:alkylation response protein AidB-like acyl-CoA dehydrogenase